MFSKELENLIQATLEDGKLEDNEKAALIKRAQREGVDLDELEIYINSLLQRRQRNLSEQKKTIEEKYEKEKKEAIGPVCPQCGKQVPPLTIKCDCGYEFRNDSVSTSMQKLSEKFSEIDSRTKGFFESKQSFESQKVQDKREAIKLLPIPNTKEDVVEFLSICIANSKKEGGVWGTKLGRVLVLGAILIVVCVVVSFIIGSIWGSKVAVWVTGYVLVLGAAWIFAYTMRATSAAIEHNYYVDTWKAKFKQVMLKGRSLRGDSDFQQQLDYFENIFNQK